jgi:uncharacterized membrane protein YhaH (DUF805 family)
MVPLFFTGAFQIHVTVIGTIVLIYWACLPGAQGPNRFGTPESAPHILGLEIPPNRSHTDEVIA